MDAIEPVVRDIAHQMLTTRGWQLARADGDGDDGDARAPPSPAMLDAVCVYVDRARARLALMFAQPRARVGIRDMRVLTEYARARDMRRLLLVTTAPVTTFAQQHLGEITHGNDLAIETWLRANLLVNPLQHRLCPPMRVVDADERRALAARYRLDRLPKILETDIVARFCGARVDDVFEVVRAHPDGYTYNVHRVVVAA